MDNKKLKALDKLEDHPNFYRRERQMILFINGNV